MRSRSRVCLRDPEAGECFLPSPPKQREAMAWAVRAKQVSHAVRAASQHTLTGGVAKSCTVCRRMVRRERDQSNWPMCMAPEPALSCTNSPVWQAMASITDARIAHIAQELLSAPPAQASTA